MSSEITQASFAQTHLRRRNGRKQACEPCRRRKVACDHGVPVCQRCRRRSTAGDCVYLTPSPDAATPSRNRPHRPHDMAPPVAHGPTPSTTTDGTPCPGSVRDTGYLGATSFSAVLQETQDNLSVQGTPYTVDQTPQTIPRPRQRVTLNQRLAAQALEALENIPERRAAHIIFKQHINPNDGWCRLAAEMLIDSLWTTFSSSLEPNRSLSGLTEMAETLSTNSQTQLNEDLIDPDEWFQSFSGNNFRWECLGILFTSWAFGALPIKIPNNFITTHQEKRAIFRKFKESAWMCAEMARDTRASNTLLVYLLYKHSLLESIDTGDFSKQRHRNPPDILTNNMSSSPILEITC